MSGYLLNSLAFYGLQRIGKVKEEIEMVDEQEIKFKQLELEKGKIA